MNEDIKDEAYDEKKRELIWNQYFPRVRLAVWINCIAAVVSYVILVILTLTNVIAVCRGKEHTYGYCFQIVIA